MSETYVHPSQRVRTEHPGIYRRGHGYSVGWRDENKKQRWKEMRSLDDAIQFKAVRDAERQGRIEEALAVNRNIKIRARADMTDVRDYIRAALAALDKSGVGTTLSNPIFAGLYAAEDGAVEAIKRSF